MQLPGLSVDKRAPSGFALPRWIKAPEPCHTPDVYFTEPVEGSSLLIVIHSHTKWIEVRRAPPPTSAATISVLRWLLATFAVPRRMMSDNESSFVSDEIRTFFERNGVQAVTSAPYRPAMNDWAKQYVAELKKARFQVPTCP